MFGDGVLPQTRWASMWSPFLPMPAHIDSMAATQRGGLSYCDCVIAAEHRHIHDLLRVDEQADMSMLQGAYLRDNGIAIFTAPVT